MVRGNTKNYTTKITCGSALSSQPQVQKKSPNLRKPVSVFVVSIIIFCLFSNGFETSTSTSSINQMVSNSISNAGFNQSNGFETSSIINTHTGFQTNGNGFRDESSSIKNKSNKRNVNSSIRNNSN